MDFLGISIKVWIGIGIFLLLAIYISVSSAASRKEELLEKIKKNWGKQGKRKLSSEELEVISHYYKKFVNDNTIDDITWNDLGMDDIFKAINITQSSIGQERLYKMLRQPDTDIEELKKLDKLATDISEHEEERVNLQLLLNGLGRTKKYAACDYIDSLSGLKVGGNVIHYLSGILIVISVVVMLTLNAAIGIVALIGTVAFAIVTYYNFKAKVEGYLICVNQIVRMLRVSKDISELKCDFISEYNEKISEYVNTFSGVLTNSWLIEGGNVDGSLGEMVMQYLRMLTHVDLIKFNKITRLVSKKEEQIYELIDVLGFIECAIAVASFRASLPEWSRPALYTYETGKGYNSSQVNLSVESAYHPKLSDPVANSITTDGHVLLTGSNASGKSTFLKTIAINALLSQILYTSVSKGYRAPFYRIMSSMALRDDLNNSDSYYIVEIKSLKRIIDASKKDGMPVLCFVDEVLRGTNTVERIAASSEILKSIDKSRALVFAATHDIELTSILNGVYENYHFQEEVTNDDVKFNFVLYKGPATTRNAIKLLKVIGYDEAIIENAEQSAMYFTNYGQWKK